MAEFYRKTRGIGLLHRCLLNPWVTDGRHCLKLTPLVPDDFGRTPNELHFAGTSTGVEGFVTGCSMECLCSHSF